MAVCPQWERAVGPQIARVAWPVAIVDVHTLVVRVKTPEWKRWLEDGSTRLVERVNAFLPGDDRLGAVQLIGPRHDVPSSSPIRRRGTQGKAS